MNVQELKAALAGNPGAHLRFILPNGQKVPAHAHVTEVARLDKRFVDCGGTLRNEARCQLQTWVAENYEHRLTAAKLLSILNKARGLLESEELPVDVEHETEWTSQFPLESFTLEGTELVLRLGVRHTACLAMEKCLPKASPASAFLKPLPVFTPRG
jgi:hypothetical protein